VRLEAGESSMDHTDTDNMQIMPSFDDLALRQILDRFLVTTFNAIVITTADEGYPIVYVNPAFCRMTGYTASELLGQSPRLFQGVLSNPKILRRLKETLDAGQSFHGATINYRKDGHSYAVEWTISPIFGGDGKITHFFSLQKDLSNLRQVVSRLKRTNQNFREFLRDLSVTAEKSTSSAIAEQIAEKKHELTEQLIDNVRLYNPALRSEQNIKLFEDTEFFDLTDDLNGVLGEKLEQRYVGAAEYLASQPLPANEIAGLLQVIEEIQQQLDLLQYSTNWSKDLLIIADNVTQVANTIFYLEDFVGISSILAELATQTRLRAKAELPAFIIDTYKALLQDLQTWVDRIFISAAADNIHEMDASIISSSRQLLMFMH